ncbi:MAG: redoxin domain-containing protein [Alphaproteobacteria bacterium]|nr:redoxin domain-containing protein [Alphaproteobacteria bacterium]
METLYLAQLALLEGIGLVISPCILPVLPIVLASSLDGGKARPLGIIAGFILSFTLFALLARQLFAFFEIDGAVVRDVALALLVGFGLMLFSEKLSGKLMAATQGLANFGQNFGSRWQGGNGFWSGVGIGSLIGLVWTPCAGPILAVAVVQIIQAQTDLAAVLTIAMFALGAGIPMLLIALMGRKAMNHMNFFKKHAAALRRGLGVIIIAMAALIWSGADVALLAATGNGEAPQTESTPTLQHALPRSYPAPEIGGIESWVNSDPLRLADLRGKVVLIDFWTYSCINCIRTMPHITKWHEKYHDKGLVIIGVHTPEFAFEKKLDNVRNATEKYGIQYPVALDNNFVTWRNFSNRYWPAHYLIDQDGRVVYQHFGEGQYDVTENNIRALLGLGAERAEAPVGGNDGARGSFLQSPETYLGHLRTEHFASPEGVKRDAASQYGFPSFLGLNGWALEGAWRFTPEHIVAEKEGSALRFNFYARKVFLVMGNTDGKPVNVRVLLNGKPVGDAAGKDAPGGIVAVDNESLYELVDLGKAGNGLLELQADAPGLQAYAFTFGG